MTTSSAARPTPAPADRATLNRRLYRFAGLALLLLAIAVAVDANLWPLVTYLSSATHLGIGKAGLLALPLLLIPLIGMLIALALMLQAGIAVYKLKKATRS